MLREFQRGGEPDLQLRAGLARHRQIKKVPDAFKDTFP
jgi:hypothetical protein